MCDSEVWGLLSLHSEGRSSSTPPTSLLLSSILTGEPVRKCLSLSLASLFCLFVYLFIHFALCVIVLLVCMSVYQVHAWCPWKSEEGTGSLWI